MAFHIHKHYYRYYGHQQTQAGYGGGALLDYLAGLVRIALEADDVKAYSGNCHGDAGRQLNDKCLHGEYDALLAVAALYLTVIHGVGEEHRRKHRQHAVACEHDYTGYAYQVDVA